MKKNLLENLVKRISKLPGLGPRSARRIIFHLLKDKNEYLQPLINELILVQEKATNCEICGNLDFEKQCSICRDNNRNNNLICVVENISDLWALERSGMYNGKYHILGGVLSAIDGINPSELNISSLENRVNASNKIE